MEHTKPWLRYVDADDISDETLELDGMKVRNDAGEKLGSVDGLIVDARSGRTYYAVVDAGGWFKTKHFLMPIGQFRLGADRDALVVSLAKDQVQRFPGFDKDAFDTLSEAEVARINSETIAIVEPTVGYAADAPYDAAWGRPSYQEPAWWLNEPSLGERVAPLAGSVPRERSAQEPQAVARDTSPHFEGRAQPGDVLGVETGGEQTHVGDTRDSENRRREQADEADRDKRR